MSFPASFPEADRLKSDLSVHPSLNTPYNQENGITKAVAELAAERFAGAQTTRLEIGLDVFIMIEDLKSGAVRFSGKTLPKFDLHRSIWNLLSKSLNRALIDCAMNHRVTVFNNCSFVNHSVFVSDL